MGLCKRWLPLSIWVIMIFSLSSIPDVTPGDMKFPVGTDKVVHFSEYAILAVLFFRGLSYGNRRFRWTLLFATIATGAALGGLDELYQSYIPGRDSSFFDFLADIAGITAGSLFAILKNMKMIRKDRLEEV
ncbi:MAG: VanZ family protein [Candidatus Krumholzibacteria bacterium]|nr:VanZ family protein [Candidatus Krumholzibacteria bacterium]